MTNPEHSCLSPGNNSRRGTIMANNVIKPSLYWGLNKLLFKKRVCKSPLTLCADAFTDSLCKERKMHREISNIPKLSNLASLIFSALRATFRRCSLFRMWQSITPISPNLAYIIRGSQFLFCSSKSLSFCPSNQRIREEDSYVSHPSFLCWFWTNWPASRCLWKCKTGGEIKSSGKRRRSVSSGGFLEDVCVETGQAGLNPWVWMMERTLER